MKLLRALNRFFSFAIALPLASLIGVMAVSFSAISAPEEKAEVLVEEEEEPLIILERNDEGRIQSTLFEEPIPPPPITHIPAFQIDGLSSEDLNDEVMIVNFFAAWCPSCQNENPLLLALKERGAAIYGISIYFQPEPHERFFEKNESPFKILGIDEFDLMDRAIAGLTIPSTMVVTKDLKIHWRYNGEITQTMVDEEILPLIEALSH
jgi:cytochrome c biogenesis protein CcmG/thiol:disulfide interchange protein DsbE